MVQMLEQLWGSGSDLNVVQMGCRGLVTFLTALALIRVSGRRSFGVGSPLDNIIVILLGALLSRAVVGASPFIPVMTTSFAVVILHRIFSSYKINHSGFSRIVEGDKIVLYTEGQFIKPNMDKALVCEEDIRQGIRESALTNDLDEIQTIYLERNGQISVIKKSGK